MIANNYIAMDNESICRVSTGSGVGKMVNFIILYDLYFFDEKIDNRYSGETGW